MRNLVTQSRVSATSKLTTIISRMTMVEGQEVGVEVGLEEGLEVEVEVGTVVV
jgi:hypothetical protein